MFHQVATKLAGLFTKSRKRRPTKNEKNKYSVLEDRRMRAGIYLDGSTGDLYVSGDAGDDAGFITETSGNRYRVVIQTETEYLSETFDVDDVSKVTFLGFKGDDAFTNATGEPSLLLGHDGNDTLIGGWGADRINGGRGDDKIEGRRGPDALIGFDGDDLIEGGSSNDKLFGGRGNNTIYGGTGDDTVYGGDDAERIFGDDGADKIFAGGGNDIIDSGDGGAGFSWALWDVVIGGSGNDTIRSGDGVKAYYGGNGNDTLLGAYDGLNRLHGQGGNDKIYAGKSSDYLTGGNGDDVIKAYGGNDHVVPGHGDDEIDLGSGQDLAIWGGTKGSFRVSGSNPLTVDDTRTYSDTGKDTVRGAEWFRFSNGTFIAKADSGGTTDPGASNREQLRFTQANRIYEGDQTSGGRKLYRFTGPISDSFSFKLTPTGTTLKRPTVVIRKANGQLVKRQTATGFTNTVRFTFNVERGTEYYLDVLGENGSNGAFIFHMNPI